MNNRARLYIFTLVFLFILQSLYSQTRVKTISQIAEENGKAVVLIATAKESDGALSLGSGFIVNSKGVIITNYHVIQGAYPALVKLTNGDIYDDISIVDTDERKDIAIIKIKGWNLPTVKLGNSDAIKVGEKIVVIGNPQGLENTVTDGLISAKRDTEAGYKLHQISAPISPGSSGSPVFNMRGEVLGIATSSIIDGQNLNFSVPINYAHGMISENIKMSLEDFARLPQKRPTLYSQDFGTITQQSFLINMNILITKMLKAYDNYTTGYLDTKHSMQKVLEKKSINFSISQYLYISKEQLIKIYKDTNELKCNNEDTLKLRDMFSELVAGSSEGLDLLISGIETVNINLMNRGLAKLSVAFQDNGNQFKHKFVEQVEEFHPELKKDILPVVLRPDLLFGKFPVYLGVYYAHSMKKIIVLGVWPDSPADKAGLRKGDEIFKLTTGSEFQSVIDLAKLIRTWKPGNTIHFWIRRGRATRVVHIKLGKPLI